MCLPLSPSHSYDLGVGVAPIPSQPWIKLPCHYSVVPSARVLHVRHSGAYLLPTSPDLWTSTVQPQTPLVRAVAPAMAQASWKITQTSQTGSGISCKCIFSIRGDEENVGIHTALNLLQPERFIVTFLLLLFTLSFPPMDTDVFTGSVASHTTSPPRSRVTSQAVICGPHRFMVM